MDRLDLLQDSDQPVRVFVGGVTTRPEGALAAAEDLYRAPAIGICAYDGKVMPDVLKAAVDYLTGQGKDTGERILDQLQEICARYGQVDMITFHSAAVVALNNDEVMNELDSLLSSGKIRLGKVVLAGAYVQPDLAAVLEKHKGMGVQAWLTLEQTPDSQSKGDPIITLTMPNRQFPDSRWAGVVKAGLLGVLVRLPLVDGGARRFYDLSVHSMRSYAPAARAFFSIPEPPPRPPRPRRSRAETVRYRRWDPPPWWPDDHGGGGGAAVASTSGGQARRRQSREPALEGGGTGAQTPTLTVTWAAGGVLQRCQAVAVLADHGSPASPIVAYYSVQQDIGIIRIGDDILFLRLNPVGQYLQVIQIAEGKAAKAPDGQLDLRLAEILFQDPPLPATVVGPTDLRDPGGVLIAPDPIGEKDNLRGLKDQVLGARPSDDALDWPAGPSEDE